MAFDYIATQTQAAILLKEFGVAVSLVRDGNVVAKTNGVFVEKKDENWEQPASSFLANTASTKRQVLLPGVIKVAPRIGDQITSENNTFKVVSMETVRPAKTVLLYKVSIE